MATAVRWRQVAREHGRAVAGKPGGDQRCSKTDAHAPLIRAMLAEQGDITLAEVQSGLAARGIKVGIGTAPGHSSGQALAAMERLTTSLPPGVTTEWTDVAFQQKLAGNAAMLVFGVATLFVFPVFAAQFESLMLPLAIILIVPMRARRAKSMFK